MSQAFSTRFVHFALVRLYLGTPHTLLNLSYLGLSLHVCVHISICELSARLTYYQPTQSFVDMSLESTLARARNFALYNDLGHAEPPTA